MKFLRKIFGIEEILHQNHLLQQTVNVLQGKFLDQEKQIFTLQLKLDTLSIALGKQEKIIKESAGILRGDIYQIQRHFSKMDESIKKMIILPEENDIEKHALDEGIDVDDEVRVPIVSGMKVRFESEGLETEIPIL